MKYLFYSITAILLLFWAVGFFFLKLGVMIHLLLAVAALTLIVGVVLGNRKMKHPYFKPMRLSIRK